MNKMIKSIVVVLLTAIITAGAFFMIEPQIMIIVPVAFVAAIAFAFRRSSLSLGLLWLPVRLWPSLSIHRLLRDYRLRADLSLCSFDGHWPCRCRPDCGGPVAGTSRPKN